MTRAITIGASVAIDAGANKITNLADPASAQDAATKAYADSVGGGSGIADPGGSNDDVLQRKTGAWTHRTIAQLLVDLAAAGTTFQPLDSDLTAIAALTTTSFGRAFLTLADAAATRTAIGTVIGTDVEAHDPDLTTIAGLSPTNDDVIQRKAGAWTNRTMANLIADLAALGTTFQPLDSDLTSIAALSTTSFGRGLLASADAAALRTSAGLGSLAVLSTITSSEITDGTIVNADVNASAAIAYSKLALGSSIVSADVVDGTLVNADINASAAIAYSKLALSGSLTLADHAAAAVTSLSGFSTAWTVVVKASDESVISSTALQNDDELLFTAAAGGLYEFQLFLIIVSPSGVSAGNWKFAFGESGTSTGALFAMGIGTAGVQGNTSGTVRTVGISAHQTIATNRPILITGCLVSAGGSTQNLQWAQNVSDANNVTVKAGSLLRYRRIL